jgi:hypothetical protein
VRGRDLDLLGRGDRGVLAAPPALLVRSTSMLSRRSVCRRR